MGENTRAMTGGSGSPDAIRQEIERTQARVGETLQEIERRLSPRHVYARARAATERAVDRAGDRGRQVIGQVDELGRGRVAGGAVGSLAAVWLLARGLRARRAQRADEVPHMTRVHSPADPEAPGDERNHHGAWATAMALVGAAGLVLAARAANRREENAAAAAVEAPVPGPPTAAPDYAQPAEHEHAVPATQL